MIFIYQVKKFKIDYKQVKNGLKTGMKDYATQMHEQIDELVKKIQTSLSKNDRKKFNTGEKNYSNQI